jgi:hypothetical protein
LPAIAEEKATFGTALEEGHAMALEDVVAYASSTLD